MAISQTQILRPNRRCRRKSPRFKIRTELSGTWSGRRSVRVSKCTSKNGRVNTLYSLHKHPRNPSKLFNQFDATHTYATTYRPPQTPIQNNTTYNNDNDDDGGDFSSQDSPSSSSGIPSLFVLTGRSPIHAATPEPDEDPDRCTNLIPQPSNNSNPFYRRPTPGGSTIGAHPTVPFDSGGTQIFLLDKWEPFEPYPTTEPTARCTRRLGDLLSSSSSSASSEGEASQVPVTLIPCLAHQILNAAPFNLAIPVCPLMICTQCSAQNRHNYSQIKEACALGVCGVCFRRESKPQGNLNNAGQPTTIKPSWNCVCQSYPSVSSGEAICAMHVEQYAREVQTRAQLCADYRRQICRLDPKKPNKKNYYRKAPPSMRYINTTYWRHKNPPNSLPPWPPTATHPKDDQNWYPVPNCPCGRPARHTRRGEANRIRSCAICTQTLGDPPLAVANPRPMTVETNTGIHVGRGVKVPEKTFQVAPFTGKSYGTEGWVRR